MEICILSMQKVPNFGSLLQSYSLKKIIESMGHNVSFIDIQGDLDDNNLLCGDIVDFSKEREGNYNIISKMSKIDKYFLNRIRIKRLSRNQDQLFDDFRIKNLEIKDEDNHKKYDVCIIGSDEVFNCLAPTKWGFTSQLFGNVMQAEKVITYAASCGSTDLYSLPTQVKDRIIEAFRNVSAFSVRDKNTSDFVSGLSNRIVHEHFDPVFVLDFTDEMLKYSECKFTSKKYCVVYSYYNRIHKKEEIDEIVNFCREKDLEIVTIGAPQMWVNNHLVLNPFEVLVAFENADFIITDTFHGTIFASKYSRKFVTLTRSSNSNKLTDLVSRLGIEKHLANNMEQIWGIYELDNNREIIHSLSERELRRTREYLVGNV